MNKTSLKTAYTLHEVALLEHNVLTMPVCRHHVTTISTPHTDYDNL